MAQGLKVNYVRELGFYPRDALSLGEQDDRGSEELSLPDMFLKGWDETD